MQGSVSSFGKWVARQEHYCDTFLPEDVKAQQKNTNNLTVPLPHHVSSYPFPYWYPCIKMRGQKKSWLKWLQGRCYSISKDQQDPFLLKVKRLFLRLKSFAAFFVHIWNWPKVSSVFIEGIKTNVFYLASYLSHRPSSHLSRSHMAWHTCQNISDIEKTQAAKSGSSYFPCHDLLWETRCAKIIPSDDKCW